MAKSSKGKIFGFLLIIAGLLWFFHWPLMNFFWYPNFNWHQITFDIGHWGDTFVFNFPRQLWNWRSIDWLRVLFFVVWIGAAIWTYRDAESRRMSGILWGLLVFAGNIVGLIVYLLVRRDTPDFTPPTAGQSAPARPKPTCSGCGKPIEKDFVVCPWCQTKLNRSCPDCGKSVQADWKACPYCAKALAAEA